MPERPYTVASLADRWGCSEGLIRNMIRRGELAHVRLGSLIRIPAAEVERVECPTTPSSDSVEDMPASGETTEEDTEFGYTRPIGLERRLRLGVDGPGAEVLRGPWERS